MQETLMERTVIAVDIAKKVFQLHWVDAETGCIERLRLKRAKLLEWFANRTVSDVVMEACGGAHEWARALSQFGHEVRLIAPRKVRPFVQRNKTDAADAQAIWTASRQPGMRFVPVKTEAQQIVLSLHRLRAQLMKTRIMQTNELRGLLYEFGIVLPEGHTALLKAVPQAMCEAKLRLPAVLTDSLDEQLRRIQQLQLDIDGIERRLSQQMRHIPACQAVAEIPGIGLLTATAVVANMGTPTAFKDAREFAAWVGLVPRQTGTGGRVRQLGISKRGDAYLRTLLIHGARSIVIRAKEIDRPGRGLLLCCSADRIAWPLQPWPTSWREQSGRYWPRVRRGARRHGRRRTDRQRNNRFLGEQATTRVMGSDRSDRDGDTPIRHESVKLGVQMGTSSAKTMGASRLCGLHNRPNIRLQPCLLPFTHTSSCNPGGAHISIALGQAPCRGTDLLSCRRNNRPTPFLCAVRCGLPVRSMSLHPTHPIPPLTLWLASSAGVRPSDRWPVRRQHPGQSNAAAYPGVLRAHGSVVVYGITGAEATLPALWMMQNAIALKFLMIYGIPAADREAGLAEVSALLHEGKLRQTIALQLPLNQAAAAHDLVEEGHQIGNVVLLIP
jgi:transposase